MPLDQLAHYDWAAPEQLLPSRIDGRELAAKRLSAIRTAMSGTPHAAILICIVSSGLIRLSISNTPERSPKSCCDSVRFLHKVLHIFHLSEKL